MAGRPLHRDLGGASANQHQRDPWGIIERLERIEDRLTEEPAPLAVDRNGAAAGLACSLSTLDALTREGMPCVRLGDPVTGARRYNLAECWGWLKARQSSANDDEPGAA